MKNFMRILCMGVMCLALMIIATSCGSDNEPVAGEGGTIVEIEGTRIYKIGSYSIEYDDDDRPYIISSRYSSYTIDYKKGIITVSDGDDEEEETIDVKFKDGYISSVSESWNYKDKYYQEKGSGKIEFKYSNGYLTEVKMESSGEEKDLEDDTSDKFKETSETKLTWKNGNMVAAVEKGSETYGKYTDSWTYDYTYSYGDVINEYNQFPICVNDCWAEDSELGVLAALGLFGKGTSYLPIGMAYTESYDGDSSNYDYRITISLNGNGSISKESYRSTSLTYYYESITRMGEAENEVIFKPIFKIFRNRKK